MVAISSSAAPWAQAAGCGAAASRLGVRRLRLVACEDPLGTPRLLVEALGQLQKVPMLAWAAHPSLALAPGQSPALVREGAIVIRITHFSHFAQKPQERCILSSQSPRVFEGSVKSSEEFARAASVSPVDMPGALLPEVAGIGERTGRSAVGTSIKALKGMRALR